MLLLFNTFVSSCARALGDEDLWLSRNIYFSSFSFRTMNNLKLVRFSSLVILPASLKKNPTLSLIKIPTCTYRMKDK